jgi:hypothetical protein
MFGLMYLSDERKRALRKLEERLANSSEPRGREEAKLLIQEIMNEAIPYQACDIYKATELKNQLMDQVSILTNLGKVQMAEAFQVHLRDIDFHIQTKQIRQTCAIMRSRFWIFNGPRKKSKPWGAPGGLLA